MNDHVVAKNIPKVAENEEPPSYTTYGKEQIKEVVMWDGWNRRE